MTTDTLEPISRNHCLFVSPVHRFSTDTILLAHFAQPKKQDKCADLGTGCGAIPMLWYARGTLRQAYGVEIQADACALFSKSIAYNHAEDKLVCVQADLRQLRTDSRFRELDLIVCNPPYKPTGTGIPCQLDSLNTARHEQNCTLEDVCSVASFALRFGGRFCICQRPERLCDVIDAFRANGLEPKRLRLVQQRPGKQPFLFLLEGRKGGKPYLKTEPVLMVEDGNKYSDEMMDIYGDYKSSPLLSGGNG
jgi:tRNA1Val (adenine37-N6)-methyltransferase